MPEIYIYYNQSKKHWLFPSGFIKYLSCFLLLLALSFNSKLSAQIVINEITGDGAIEFKNTGSSTVNVASYYFCQSPAYNQIGAMNILCGSLEVPAGGFITINSFGVLNGADGEFGLYTSTAWSDPNAIVDYVEWGSSGHERSSVAVAAGIWSSGDFVPSFNFSLSYDGSGNSSSDWMDHSNTFCNENPNFEPCTVEGGTLSVDLSLSLLVMVFRI